MREIKTIETDRYEKAEDNIHLKHVGMISSQDAFDQLKKHLTEVGLLPDEYFLSSIHLSPEHELPDYSEAICHTNWGGNEGIYIDIELVYRQNGEPKSFHLATGKTLEQDGDAFLRMSRIAAECSIMLNGRGSIVRVSDKYYENDKAPEQINASLTSQIQSATARAAGPVSETVEKDTAPEH